MFRQGDVLIIPIAKLPAKLQKVPRENGRAVLAGHAHAITDQRAALFRDPKLAPIFMHVSGDSPVALERFGRRAAGIAAPEVCCGSDCRDAPPGPTAAYPLIASVSDP